jgi:trigger factor
MVEIKKINDEKLNKKFNVKVLKDDFNKEFENKVLDVQKTIKIDGFRKGKVPVDFIKNKYSASVLSETAESITEKNINKIIKENNFELVSRPNVNVTSLEIDKDFEFEVEFEIFPEIPEISYKKISLKKNKVKVDKKDIEEGKFKLLKGKTEWKEEDKEYKAKNGDKVKIDFLGKINDVAFDGGKAEKYDLELGSKSFIDNFEEQLIGLKTDDEIDVKVNFPENYQKVDLAGKPAVFEVKIHSISTPKIPELTDDFLKQNFNIENVEKLEEMIEKEMSDLYDREIKNKLKTDIFAWLEKNVKIDLPKSLLSGEIEKNLKSFEEELKTNPDKFKNDEETEKVKAQIKEKAENSIKLGLILSEIGKSNNIKVENSEIVEEIRKIASAYPGQEQLFMEFYLKNANIVNQLKNNIYENKIIDYIISNASVEEISISVEDFIKSK